MTKEAKIIKRAMGVDGGNSAIKICANGELLSFENIFCARGPIKKKLLTEYQLNSKEVVSDLKSLLDVKFTDKIGTSEFVFGNQATKYRKSIEERENYEKSNDTQLVRNCILAVATTVLEGLSKEDLTEEVNVEMDLCTGLPFQEYMIDGTVKKYADLFKGEHEIEFLNPKFPIKKMNITIKNIIIDIEGMAALRQVIFEKNLCNEENIAKLVGKAITLIDIGCYTTDIVGGTFVISKDENGNDYLKFESNPELCLGIPKGIGSAMDLTIEDLCTEYNGDIMDGDISRKDILDAINNKYNPNELVGKGISIEPFFSQQVSDLAEHLSEKYAKKYLNSGFQSNVAMIFMAGGGSNSKTMMDKFSEQIKNSPMKKASIEKIEHNVFKNSEGYNSIAQVSFK